MDESKEILLLKGQNGILNSVERINEKGEKILGPVSSGHISGIRLYDKGEAESMVQTLVESLGSGSLEDYKNFILFRAPASYIEKVCTEHENENLTINLFDSKWLSEHYVNVYRYCEKNEQKMSVDNNANTYHALDINKIDKAEVLQDWGINLDSLRDSGDLDKMLNYGRSSLITCYPIIGGTCFPMQAKFSFAEKSDGRIAIIPHPIRKTANLREYRGYTFTEDDRSNLLLNGNLGHTIQVTNKISGKTTEVYVSLDKEINEVVSLAKGCIKIPTKIKGITLSEQQHKKLSDGEQITLYGLKSASNSTYDVCLQVSAERRSISFRIPSLKRNQGLYIGGRLLGKDITEQMRRDWDEGKWVYIEDMISRSGQRFSSYVRPNYNTKKFDFIRRLPSNDITHNMMLNKSKKVSNFLDDLSKGDLQAEKIADAKIQNFNQQHKMRL